MEESSTCHPEDVVCRSWEAENEIKFASASGTSSVATNRERVKGRRLRLLKGPNGRKGSVERTEVGILSGTMIGSGDGTSHGTDVETDVGSGRGTSCGMGLGIGSEIGSGIGPEVGPGTSDGTRSGTSSEVGTDSLGKRALKSREDEVFPRLDVAKSVASPTFLDNNSLLRNSLSRSSLNRYRLNRHSHNSYNTSNEITKNDQRHNDQPYNERRDESIAVPATEEASLVEFAIHWVQEVGHPLTSYEKEGLVRFQRLGYTEELFLEALRCAVAADNRRMGYVLGILRNWYQEGVRCLEDVVAVTKRWEDLRFLKRSEIG